MNARGYRTGRDCVHARTRRTGHRTPDAPRFLSVSRGGSLRLRGPRTAQATAPDAMASAISNVDMATWVVTSGGPHPECPSECPSVCAREARNHQVWSGGVLRRVGSSLRQNVGHDARGETCRPGEREVGAVERTHNFMCSKPLDSRFLRIGIIFLLAKSRMRLFRPLRSVVVFRRTSRPPLAPGVGGQSRRVVCNDT